MDVKIKRVESRGDLEQFLAVPKYIYKRYPLRVEPLVSEQIDILSQAHPFYADGRRARIQCFLALHSLSGQPIGRIAAIFNASVQKDQDSKEVVGHFGFFECEDSHEIAQCLFDIAGQWLAAQGATLMRGPTNPSQSYEYGLLVEGFDYQHRFLLPYNPPYYGEFLASSGFVKARDLLVFSMDLTDQQLKLQIEHDIERFERLREQRFPNINVRPIKLGNLKEEVEPLVGVMNDALRYHWDYTPMRPQELHLTASKLRPILDPDLALVVQNSGKPAGMVLVIPDLNEVIRHLSTRNRYLQLLELLFRAKLSRPKCARLVFLGVSQEQTTFGLLPYLLLDMYRRVAAHGYTKLDLHWILEDNLNVLGIVQRYRLQPDRIYRIYNRSNYSACF